MASAILFLLEFIPRFNFTDVECRSGRIVFVRAFCGRFRDIYGTSITSQQTRKTNLQLCRVRENPNLQNDRLIGCKTFEQTNWMTQHAQSIERCTEKVVSALPSTAIRICINLSFVQRAKNVRLWKIIFFVIIFVRQRLASSSLLTPLTLSSLFLSQSFSLLLKKHRISKPYIGSPPSGSAAPSVLYVFLFFIPFSRER